MDPLTKYKKSVEDRLNNADLLVNQTVLENNKLQIKLQQQTDEIEKLTQQLTQLRQEVANLHKEKDQQHENTNIIKDFFAHLCNVTIHKLPIEDDTGLWFNISQRNDSQTLTIDYKIGFVKNNDNETEIIYIPILKKIKSDELVLLQKVLPDYMFETLSFPMQSINQFYNKMNKCLNKN